MCLSVRTSKSYQVEEIHENQESPRGKQEQETEA